MRRRQEAEAETVGTRKTPGAIRNTLKSISAANLARPTLRGSTTRVLLVKSDAWTAAGEFKRRGTAEYVEEMFAKHGLRSRVRRRGGRYFVEVSVHDFDHSQRLLRIDPFARVARRSPRRVDFTLLTGMFSILGAGIGAAGAQAAGDASSAALVGLCLCCGLLLGGAIGVLLARRPAVRQ